MPVSAEEKAASGLAQHYLALRDELLRFLTARLGTREDGEEVLQELWLRIGAAQTGPVANPRAYLYRAAQNLAIERVRESRRRQVRDHDWSETRRAPIAGPEPADPSLGADEAMVAREELALLASAIAALPEAAGRAFRMHKFDGLPHAEIAARLGISRSGVEKHIALAMVHLRRSLVN